MEGGRSVEEEEEEEAGDEQHEDSDGLAWKEFFGSSVSLAPSLLSIFDRQVAETTSSRSQCNSPRTAAGLRSSTERTVAAADDNSGGRGIIDQATHNSSAIAEKHDAKNRAAAAVVATQPDPKRAPENGLMVDDGSNAARMLSSLCTGRSETDPDLKKRPLSLRSTSSNSSSSLSLQPHRRKKIARDASTEKSLAPSLSIFSDSSCELPTPGEKLESRSRHEGGKSLQNGSHHENGRNLRSGLRREEKLCRSESAPTGRSLSRLDFSDRKSEECLLTTENYQDYACMEVDEDLDWSPTPSDGKDVAEKRMSRICQVESTSYTDRVVREIVETERAYVRDLQDIIQGYVEYVHKTPGLLSKADASTLFGNIEDVYRFHSEFLRKLEKSGTDPVRIAECFVQSSSGFTIYSDYCTNYPRSVGILTRCSQDRQIAEVLCRQQMSLQHGLPLGSYLLKPVQRILKYHLLLQNLLNNYDRSGSGSEVISRALGSMMSVAQRINDMKRAHEHSVRIQEIQSLLYDWNGLDANSYGDLVLEDQFQMFGAKAFRLVWVFRKAVVIAKKKEDETVQVKTAIMFSNLMLVETIQRAPLNFHLIPFDNPKIQYTVQARTVDQKRHWCQEIKRLILENYEAVIPEKAKQLVMIMGKNEQDFAPSADGDSEPAKTSAILERRKGRQRSTGFIPDLGILKSKKGSKVESPGTATPDSDATWKIGVGPDVFRRGVELKGVVSESFCQDLNRKSRVLHTSFSLQNIQNSLTMVPLRKLGGSEGDWRSDSNERHPLHAKKLLAAESLEEEFSESDSQLNSSQSVKSSDWPRHTLSKETAAKPQTPAISEEPLVGSSGHLPLGSTNSSPCSEDIGLFQNGLLKKKNDIKSQHSFKSGFSEFGGNKFHAAVSLDAEQFLREHTPPNATKHKPMPNDLRARNLPPFFDDRSCSSDSLVRNSGVQKSFGNVFVDRTAFLVSESNGCLGSNRGLDRRLARLCTPPRELGSPAFVRDVRLSKERGKTVVHYGTPMRMVEFPDDICGGNTSGISGLESDITQDLTRSGNRKMNSGKSPEYPIINGSLEIFQGHPRRSTSVQEDMIHSCVQIPGENSIKAKAKRSGSFHGNSFYSTVRLHPEPPKLPAPEVKSPVSSIKSTLLSWTEKLTKRRSRSTENHAGLETGTSAGIDEASGDKTKNKSSKFVARLARASYRKLKREKSMEIVDSCENESVEPQPEYVVTVPKVLRPEEELCQQVMAQRTRVLSSYALTSLPKQNHMESTSDIDTGHQAAFQNSDQQGTTVIETLASEPFVRRPQNSCSTGWTQDEADPRKLPCNDVVFHLRYIDDDDASIISEQIEETNANERADLNEVVNSSPMKTKACSAMSLPGMRNGFAWSNSLYAISQADGWTRASVSTDGRLNCFKAPRGHWIPYIDDSGDDD